MIVPSSFKAQSPTDKLSNNRPPLQQTSSLLCQQEFHVKLTSRTQYSVFSSFLFGNPIWEENKIDR